MKVLGIDPGFGRCGVAVVAKEAGREHVVYSTCIETSADRSFPERLLIVVDVCAGLMAEHAPSAVAMERLFFSTNQKTAMQVAEVRGALIYLAARSGIPLFEYTPAQVKSATTGWGKSDKKSVARMIHTLMRIEKAVVHDDEYDALAVALTHLAHSR